MNAPAAVESPLAAAERLFCRLAAERLDALEDARLRYSEGRAPFEALAEIGGIAHKIAGTAATLGHADIGRIAAEVERLVAIGATGPEIMPVLDPLMEALEALPRP
ncbi:Hpt domain-containing protein [Paragemmobacter straminiformis]|uniref:Hpt domain-containing protein n=1 Tax=Paragemmobacter straminiformis TaxID=2045119 RepID=A0A842I8Q5_9RHOB|nr:Hpt domain-containing protein [Gemmobacter straminiformis]MBC2835996.1 Hpt domain-containing protein [Gemmobacter straminiformis]